ncbi:MAG: hypothetical protein ACR2KI_07100 [Candidatus Limnocylindria bacterium]
MSGRHRAFVVGLTAASLVVVVLLVLSASRLCPGDQAGQPCPDATAHRVLVVGLAATGVALLVAPFAFLAEYVARRRIVYRGAWPRAARRAAIAGAVMASLAGLRLGGALTVAVALFVLFLAGVVEWFAVRRLDAP